MQVKNIKKWKKDYYEKQNKHKTRKQSCFRVKILNKIKETKLFLSGRPIDLGDACSLVGNSGCLLDNTHGEQIDSNQSVIRFNHAVTEGYEHSVGTKTNLRILNCHSILNILDDSYYTTQKSRFPELDRHMLYDFKNENLVFKTDPSWQLWRHKEILEKVEQDNNVYFIDEAFYNLGKKLNNGKEATNGFIGLLLALKSCRKIDCFGFSFYKSGAKKHYYEEVNEYNQKMGHDFSQEEKWFLLLEKNEIIKFYR